MFYDPCADLTLTTDRLSALFKQVEDPDTAGTYDGVTRLSIGQLLGLPQSALEEIKRSYESNAECLEAYLDTYSHHHPCPSWKKIVDVLLNCNLNRQFEDVMVTYVKVNYLAIARLSLEMY